MLPVGFFELVIIGVFALVFIGPKRLPEVMRQAGRIFVRVRRTANDVRSTFDDVIKQAEADLHREEADSLRKALQPVQDLHNDVKKILNVNPLPNQPLLPGGLASVFDHPVDQPPTMTVEQAAANAAAAAAAAASHVAQTTAAAAPVAPVAYSPPQTPTTPADPLVPTASGAPPPKDPT